MVTTSRSYSASEVTTLWRYTNLFIIIIIIIITQHTDSRCQVSKCKSCSCEDGLMRMADPSFVEACRQHTTSRYYNCDHDVASDNEIVNDRTWLTCPTYIGKALCRRI